MRVLSIVHQRDAGPGVFADAVRAAGWDMDEWLAPAQPDAPDLGGYDAVMTFGGAQNAGDGSGWIEREREVLRDAIARDLPLLGICLGAELVAEAAGARVRRSAEPEIGWCPVELTAAGAGDPVLGGAPSSFDAFQWHSFEFTVPAGATELARSSVCPQAFVLGRTWSIQFHPEVSLADAERWIDDYRSDPDAVAIGLDPEHLRAQTRERSGAWGELGRTLCARFLEAATPA